MKDRIIVKKILNYIGKILDYTKDYNYEQFVDNSMLVEACVFNLGQIGELANKISDDFEREHMDIPWRILYGLRNIIVHDYEGVNLVLIWDIISEDLMSLREQLSILNNSLQ